MKVGVLGTGMVGKTIAGKLISLGHDVMMGARSSRDEKLVAFTSATAGKGGTFAEAAAHGEMIVHCTRGDSALVVLRQCGEHLDGKVVVDISNPLDFSKGFPPTLSVSNTDSLGETIQREFPRARVVKTLNTVTASVMIEPQKIRSAHTVFVSGNDSGAKGKVMDLLRSFGWRSIVDLGDISTARGTEQFLPLWVRLYGVLGTGEFNIALVTAAD